MSKRAVLEPDLKTPEMTAEILAGAQDQLGVVPNMCAALANLPAVPRHYTRIYNAFRDPAGLSPAEQETVFLPISAANGYRCCVAADGGAASVPGKRQVTRTTEVQKTRKDTLCMQN